MGAKKPRPIGNYRQRPPGRDPGTQPIDEVALFLHPAGRGELSTDLWTVSVTVVIFLVRARDGPQRRLLAAVVNGGCEGGGVMVEKVVIGCPGWCVARHEDEDENGMMRHRSAVLELGVIERSESSAGEATDLVVELYRLEGESTTWVYIGDGFDQYLELSLESVLRLVTVLGRLRAA